MPPCLHASIIVRTRRGFTLSELLISLAVLGLISALTLPTIYNNVNANQMKAKQREAIQVMQEIIYTGYLNGDLQAITDWTVDSTNDPIVQYFINKLAGARHCPQGVTAIPCTHNWHNAGFSHPWNNHSGRWVLPNGVGIWTIDPAGGPNSWIGFQIDGNMNNTTSTYSSTGGGEYLSFRCNISDTNQNFVSNQPTKPGQCSPWADSVVPGYNALYQ